MKKVRFKNNDGVISEEICELVETIGDVCRIQRPSGEVIRIFSDRIYDVDSAPNNQEQVKEKEETIVKEKVPEPDEVEMFDPWDGLPADGEVWIKSNTFNDTTICQTVAIVMPSQNKYRSANTYNGIARKIMEYPIKNINDLHRRMARKGYEQQERPE